ncbi:MAG: integral rane protein [Acidimicrobiales bacterium]|nr:integral rane protein [Acidimicrobiales bacterium]
MFIAYTIIAVVLALSLLASAAMKLRRDPRVVESIHDTVGVPLRFLPHLAALEIAAAAGLLIGLVWAPLSVAAAAGAVLYMIGAVVSHARVHDLKGIANPALPLALAIAALVTRLLSM